MFKRAKHPVRHAVSAFIVFVLSVSLTLSPTASYAQSVFQLPTPGTMVSQSPSFVPVLLKGMTIHPEDPFQFDFIVDGGEANLPSDALRQESERLVKYFLASMTVPQNDFWVNLSPNEPDRIIPDSLGKTELGRDMLAQDYILKQLTASLMYPEKELGQKFWNKVRKQAKEQFGIEEIPTNTFNKVWIMPESATVYENGPTVYIVESRLKVMLGEDYLAVSHQPSAIHQEKDSLTADSWKLTATAIKELILPAIEREVNEGKNFAPLRQIYHSLILAKWYKDVVRNSLLSEAYVNQNKTEGIELADKTSKDQIYERYITAYKQGVYDYIREDYDPQTQSVVPQKYFSGGIVDSDLAMSSTDDATRIAAAQVGPQHHLQIVLEPTNDLAILPLDEETEKFVRQKGIKQTIATRLPVEQDRPALNIQSLLNHESAKEGSTPVTIPHLPGGLNIEILSQISEDIYFVEFNAPKSSLGYELHVRGLIHKNHLNMITATFKTISHQHFSPTNKDYYKYITLTNQFFRSALNLLLPVRQTEIGESSVAFELIWPFESSHSAKITFSQTSESNETVVKMIAPDQEKEGTFIETEGFMDAYNFFDWVLSLQHYTLTKDNEAFFALFSAMSKSMAVKRDVQIAGKWITADQLFVALKMVEHFIDKGLPDDLTEAVITQEIKAYDDRFKIDSPLWSEGLSEAVAAIAKKISADLEINLTPGEPEQTIAQIKAVKNRAKEKIKGWIKSLSEELLAHATTLKQEYRTIDEVPDLRYKNVPAKVDDTSPFVQNIFPSTLRQFLSFVDESSRLEPLDSNEREGLYIRLYNFLTANIAVADLRINIPENPEKHLTGIAPFHLFKNFDHYVERSNIGWYHPDLDHIVSFEKVEGDRRSSDGIVYKVHFFKEYGYSVIIPSDSLDDENPYIYITHPGEEGLVEKSGHFNFIELIQLLMTFKYFSLKDDASAKSKSTRFETAADSLLFSDDTIRVNGREFDVGVILQALNYIQSSESKVEYASLPLGDKIKKGIHFYKPIGFSGLQFQDAVDALFDQMANELGLAVSITQENHNYVPTILKEYTIRFARSSVAGINAFLSARKEGVDLADILKQKVDRWVEEKEREIWGGGYTITGRYKVLEPATDEAMLQGSFTEALSTDPFVSLGAVVVLAAVGTLAISAIAASGRGDFIIGHDTPEMAKLRIVLRKRKLTGLIQKLSIPIRKDVYEEVVTDITNMGAVIVGDLLKEMKENALSIQMRGMKRALIKLGDEDTVKAIEEFISANDLSERKQAIFLSAQKEIKTKIALAKALADAHLAEAWKTTDEGGQDARLINITVTQKGEISVKTRPLKDRFETIPRLNVNNETVRLTLELNNEGAGIDMPKEIAKNLKKSSRGRTIFDVIDRFNKTDAAMTSDAEAFKASPFGQLMERDRELGRESVTRNTIYYILWRQSQLAKPIQFTRAELVKEIKDMFDVKDSVAQGRVTAAVSALWYRGNLLDHSAKYKPRKAKTPLQLYMWLIHALHQDPQKVIALMEEHLIPPPKSKKAIFRQGRNISSEFKKDIIKQFGNTELMLGSVDPLRLMERLPEAVTKSIMEVPPTHNNDVAKFLPVNAIRHALSPDFTGDSQHGVLVRTTYIAMLHEQSIDHPEAEELAMIEATRDDVLSKMLGNIDPRYVYELLDAGKQKSIDAYRQPRLNDGATQAEANRAVMIGGSGFQQDYIQDAYKKALKEKYPYLSRLSLQQITEEESVRDVSVRKQEPLIKPAMPAATVEVKDEDESIPELTVTKILGEANDEGGGLTKGEFRITISPFMYHFAITNGEVAVFLRNPDGMGGSTELGVFDIDEPLTLGTGPDNTIQILEEHNLLGSPYRFSIRISEINPGAYSFVVRNDGKKVNDVSVSWVDIGRNPEIIDKLKTWFKKDQSKLKAFLASTTGVDLTNILDFLRRRYSKGNDMLGMAIASFYLDENNGFIFRLLDQGLIEQAQELIESITKNNAEYFEFYTQWVQAKEQTQRFYTNNDYKQFVQNALEEAGKTPEEVNILLETVEDSSEDMLEINEILAALNILTRAVTAEKLNPSVLHIPALEVIAQKFGMFTSNAYKELLTFAREAPADQPQNNALTPQSLMDIIGQFDSYGEFMLHFSEKAKGLQTEPASPAFPGEDERKLTPQQKQQQDLLKGIRITEEQFDEIKEQIEAAPVKHILRLENELFNIQNGMQIGRVANTLFDQSPAGKEQERLRQLRTHITGIMERINERLKSEDGDINTIRDTIAPSMGGIAGLLEALWIYEFDKERSVKIPLKTRVLRLLLEPWQLKTIEKQVRHSSLPGLLRIEHLLRRIVERQEDLLNDYAETDGFRKYEKSAVMHSLLAQRREINSLLSLIRERELTDAAMAPIDSDDENEKLLKAQITAGKYFPYSPTNQIGLAKHHIKNLTNPNTSLVLESIKSLAALGDPEAIEPLLRQLRNPEAEVRREAHKALQSLGVVRAQLIDSYIIGLRSDALTVRKEAARMLTALKTTKAKKIEGYKRALAASNPSAREEAVKALQELGKNDKSGKISNNLILRLKIESKLSVLLALIKALGELGKKQSIRPLSKFFNSGAYTFNDSIYEALIIALIQLGSFEIAIKELSGLHKDRRKFIAKTLTGKVPNRRLAFAYGKNLQSPNAEIRKEARQAMKDLSATNDQIIQANVEALKSRFTDVSEEAIDELGGLSDPKASTPLIKYFTAEGGRTFRIRRKIIQALGNTDGEDSLDFLRKQFYQEDDWRIQRDIVKALGKLKDVESVDLLIEALSYYNMVAQAAAVSLGQIGDPKAIKALTVIAKRNDTVVKEAALEALEKIGDDPRESTETEFRSDKAMASDVGGIDLNKIEMKREGRGGAIQFDPAVVAPIVSPDFKGLRPVIINLTPVQNIFPLLGLDPSGGDPTPTPTETPPQMAVLMSNEKL